MEEVISAARSANIHNFVTSLPNGYQTRYEYCSYINMAIHFIIHSFVTSLPKGYQTRYE